MRKRNIAKVDGATSNARAIYRLSLAFDSKLVELHFSGSNLRYDRLRQTSSTVIIINEACVL